MPEEGGAPDPGRYLTKCTTEISGTDLTGKFNIGVPSGKISIMGMRKHLHENEKLT